MKTANRPVNSADAEAAAVKVDRGAQEPGDWRIGLLARIRQLILEADPEMEEEWKWQKPSSPGLPVWSHHGGVCTGETYQQVVKLTFFRGAALSDPEQLFNASLDGKTRRAINLREGQMVNEAAFKQLIRAAVAANAAVQAQRAAKTVSARPTGSSNRNSSA